MNEPASNPLQPEDHQALVRRFDAGERSPALLDALNRAAFECFHSPWEHYRALAKTEGFLQETEEALGCDLAWLEDHGTLDATESMVPEMKPLQFHLCSLGHRVFTDGMLSLRAEAPYDAMADCNATLALDIDPCDKVVLVRAWSDIRDDSWNPVLAKRICLRWNRKMPRLQARMQTPPDGTEGAGERIIAETRIALDACLASPEDIRGILQQILKDCRAFWRFARRGLRPPPPI
jgi:hypothetical protein